MRIVFSGLLHWSPILFCLSHDASFYLPDPLQSCHDARHFVPFLSSDLYRARGGVQGAIERAAPTLAAAHAISRAVSIPVMAASGLSDVTAPMALAAGARGVGVGSAGDAWQMVERVASEKHFK